MQCKKIALRLTWSLAPHPPTGNFASVCVTPFLSIFSVGLTSRMRYAHFNRYVKTYVDPFARIWLGFATTDSQSDDYIVQNYSKIVKHKCDIYKYLWLECYCPNIESNFPNIIASLKGCSKLKRLH